MPYSNAASANSHISWVTGAAGATFYLRGLYQRLGDSKQASRADKAGKSVQEQLQRMAPDSARHLTFVCHRLRELEQSEGDGASERQAWTEAIHGLLAIAIWAGVADSIQEKGTPSSILKKATQALEAALEATRTAFSDEERRSIVERVAPKAVEESVAGLVDLLKAQGPDGELLIEGLESQVKTSVDRYLGPWVA